VADRTYIQWENSNDNTKYPFSVNASLTNGSVFIPDTAFADARVHAIGGAAQQYLSSIVKNGNDVTINISDASGLLCSTAVVLGTEVERLALTDSYGRPAGILLTDATRLAFLTGYPEGTHTFRPAQTEFISAVVTPIPQTGVQGFVSNDTEYVSDDVLLVGGRGVILEVEDGETANPKIKVHGVGEPLFKRELCDEAEGEFPSRCYLQTINDIGPDEYGNFEITICGFTVEESLMRIQPMAHGLSISSVVGRISTNG